MAKTRNLILVILLLITVIIISGCILKNNLKQNQGAPLLKVFGKANVAVNIIDKEIRENNIAATAKIEKILNYTKLEYDGVLLDEGKTITIEFTGVGDKTNWKINEVESNNKIQVELRCLDGRVSSLETFTKNDCYWEGADETVSVVQ